MGFTLVSTTESQKELNRVVDSDDWKTAPIKPDDPPGPGDIPKNISQRLYNELREEQIREKKRAGPLLLQDDGRDTSKSERLEEIEAAIKKAKQAESRKSAAESRVAELRAKIGSDTAETETQPPAYDSELRPGARERHQAGVAKFGTDFANALTAAGDVLIPTRAVTAIEAMRNSEDIVYYLAKNPGICEELMENADSATQRIGEISRELQNGVQPRQAPQVQQQPHADPETARQMEKYQGHIERTRLLLATHPEAVASFRSSGIGISPAVEMALVEQDNGPDVTLHLLEHPELRAELNQLSYPTAMARVSRIAAQLEAANKRVRPPEPITPVGGSSSKTSGIPLDQLPPREYIAARNRQEFLRKREGRR